MTAPAIGGRCAIVAVEPDVQRSLARSFNLTDPWAIAGVSAPHAGRIVTAASVIAHPLMLTRLLHRLVTPRVAVVLRDPVTQVSAHYEENRRRGVEWRPMQLALAQERAHMDRLADLWDLPPRFDDVFPVYAYGALADYERWLAPWRKALGSDLLVLDSFDDAHVGDLEEHFELEATGTVISAPDADQTALDPEVDRWIRGMLDA